MSKCLLIKAEYLQGEQELVVARGLDRDEKVVSSSGRNIQHLYSTHEEADTRIVLHSLDAKNESYYCVVVQSRDTDVLVLMLVHETTDQVWVSSGTSKQSCFVPVHTVKQSLTPHILASVLPFHCITGCDTVSRFYNHGKKSAWKVFTDNTKTLEEFGTGSDADFPSQLKTAEICIVKMYSPKSKLTSVNSLRAAMFNKVDPESLPPTSDALHCHLLRCLYQVIEW